MVRMPADVGPSEAAFRDLRSSTTYMAWKVWLGTASTCLLIGSGYWGPVPDIEAATVDIPLSQADPFQSVGSEYAGTRFRKTPEGRRFFGEYRFELQLSNQALVPIRPRCGFWPDSGELGGGGWLTETLPTLAPGESLFVEGVTARPDRRGTFVPSEGSIVCKPSNALFGHFPIVVPY